MPYKDPQKQRAAQAAWHQRNKAARALAKKRRRPAAGPEHRREEHRQYRLKRGQSLLEYKIEWRGNRAYGDFWPAAKALRVLEKEVKNEKSIRTNR